MINLKSERYFFNLSVNALDILNKSSLSRSFNTAEIASIRKIRHSNHCQVGLFDCSQLIKQDDYLTGFLKSKVCLNCDPPLWTQRCNKYLTKLIFSVCTLRYGTSFFSFSPFWPQIQMKNSASNLVSERYSYLEKSMTIFGQRIILIKSIERSPKHNFKTNSVVDQKNSPCTCS